MTATLQRGTKGKHERLPNVSQNGHSRRDGFVFAGGLIAEFSAKTLTHFGIENNDRQHAHERQLEPDVKEVHRIHEKNEQRRAAAC